MNEKNVFLRVRALKRDAVQMERDSGAFERIFGVTEVCALGGKDGRSEEQRQKEA